MKIVFKTFFLHQENLTSSVRFIIIKVRTSRNDVIALQQKIGKMILFLINIYSFFKCFKEQTVEQKQGLCLPSIETKNVPILLPCVPNTRLNNIHNVGTTSCER